MVWCVCGLVWCLCGGCEAIYNFDAHTDNVHLCHVMVLAIAAGVINLAIDYYYYFKI